MQGTAGDLHSVPTCSDWPLRSAGRRASDRNLGRSCRWQRLKHLLPAVRLLLGIYAAGLGIPFILAAMFMSQAMGFMNRIKRHMNVIEKSMGALLILVGVAMVSGAFTSFSYWLLEQFPALATLG